MDKNKPISLLCPEAKLFLDNLTTLLSEQEITTSLDDSALNLLGRSFNNYTIAGKILDKRYEELGEEGYLITSPRGEIKAHPAVKMLLDAEIQLDKLFSKFGLNPHSRKEISKPKERGEKLEAIDIFLREVKK